MVNSVRDFRLDLLRVLAISMIVLMHSPNPQSNTPGFVLAGISYATAAGLVLFFMISGALLLGSRLSTKEFLKRRFSKVLWPTLFWTLFYLVINYVSDPPTARTVFRQIGSIPFCRQGNGVLWFMYVLAGLYLLTPILSQWLRNATKQEVRFYLSLWALTLIYPYLGMFLEINDTKDGILYYFTGYVGYYVLGYYLRYHYQYKWWHVLVAFVIAVTVPIVLYSSGIEFDFYESLWYLSLPVAMMAFIWYVLVFKLPVKRVVLIEKMSSLSFGVFFVHVLIIKRLAWNIGAIHALPDVIEVIAIMLVTLLLSYLISWLLSRLPFSKYIIGV